MVPIVFSLKFVSVTKQLHYASLLKDSFSQVDCDFLRGLLSGFTTVAHSGCAN